jgi:hypothetical protein
MRSKVFQLPGSGHVRNQLTRSQSSFSQASIFADMHSAQKTLCYGPRVHRESPPPGANPISDGQVTCHIW